MRSGPARRRIGRREELGCDLARSTECSVIEYGQILLDRTSRSFQRKPLLAFYALLPVRIRLDQAGIDRKTFAPTNPSLIQRRSTVSNRRRRRSLWRKRPCRFLEKVE